MKDHTLICVCMFVSLGIFEVVEYILNNISLFKLIICLILAHINSLRNK
jgi:hypothetical protein